MEMHEYLEKYCKVLGKSGQLKYQKGFHGNCGKYFCYVKEFVWVVVEGKGCPRFSGHGCSCFGHGNNRRDRELAGKWKSQVEKQKILTQLIEKYPLNQHFQFLFRSLS